MAATFSDELWTAAFEAVISQFEIQKLFPEQKESIKTFFEGKNVFVNLPTGFGKSLIFQSLPIVSDVLNRKPRGSSIIIVISPLKSLMEDQITFVSNFGIPAISLSQCDDPDIVQQVFDGCYNLVYASPESLLSNVWRDLFKCDSLKNNIIGIAVDEAHVVSQWGLSNKTSTAFRKWYGCLGELQSLKPKDCKLIILTATATSLTKKKILDSLNIKEKDVNIIERSPDRPNIKYTVQYMDRCQPLEETLGSLIKEIARKGVETPKVLIYCQTRKQCAILFRVFEVYLKDSIFVGDKSPKNRLVDMFHAGTPTTVKEHICKTMSLEDGNIRVLISTVAFGMGVDCKAIRRVIHFGPSKSIEQYVQECGRAGRDGKPSICVLLYNGLLSAFCEEPMKEFSVAEDKCRRKFLMDHFGFKVAVESVPVPLHKCCDICSKSANVRMRIVQTVGVQESKRVSFPLKWNASVIIVVTYQDLSQRNKKAVTTELCNLQKELLSGMSVDARTLVSCPNVILELSKFQIEQVVQNSHRLFTIQDIFKYVEVWRKQYAYKILEILNNIFGDVDESSLVHFEETENIDDIEYEWEMLRDDHSLQSLMDTSELPSGLSNLDSTLNSTTNFDTSGFISGLAVNLGNQ